MSYDLSQLLSQEFELLAATLLFHRDGLVFEHFGLGADSGIDLRCASPEDDLVIVQCKNYAPNGWQDLKKSLRQYSAQRNSIEDLSGKPVTRLIIVTATSLTPGRKREIEDILSEWPIASSDIVGRDDINVLLTNFPQVVQEFPTLWLRSPKYIDAILR